eukprot:scpid32052/ scgid32459/ 
MTLGGRHPSKRQGLDKQAVLLCSSEKKMGSVEFRNKKICAQEIFVSSKQRLKKAFMWHEIFRSVKPVAMLCLAWKVCLLSDLPPHMADLHYSVNNVRDTYEVT